MKEVHFTAYLSEDSSTISKIEADVVYANLIGYTCSQISLN